MAGQGTPQEESGGGDLLVDGHFLDVPGPVVVARVTARALRRGDSGILGCEDDDAHALVVPRAQQPLATHEPSLLPGPADDVFAKVAGDRVGLNCRG